MENEPPVPKNNKLQNSQPLYNTLKSQEELFSRKHISPFYLLLQKEMEKNLILKGFEPRPLSLLFALETLIKYYLFNNRPKIVP